MFERLSLDIFFATRRMRRRMMIALLAAAGFTHPASAQNTGAAAPNAAPPSLFVSRLANPAPLRFGLTVEETAAAIGTPLTRVREGRHDRHGQRGDVLMRAEVDAGHGGLFAAPATLYLQFRRDRLTGWKVERRRTAPLMF